MNRYFILIALIVTGFTINATPPTGIDKTKLNGENGTGRTLEEVVVRSERAWVEGNKAVFIPTRSEKNLSDDPVSLIESMNIPLVNVVGGTLKSISGRDVTIFINGIKATDVDISTFWSKQVRRIEYLERPADPAFEGVAAAINFIMPVYIVGGVTKIDMDQDIPNDGDYEIASKLAYRRMTYGALFSGGYSRDHMSSTTGEEIYNDVYYDGIRYDHISREFEEHSWSRKNNVNASLNARYITDGIRITHTASLNWTRYPGSGSTASDLWRPDLFGGNLSHTGTNGRILSPQLSGEYNFRLPKGWNMFVRWRYSNAVNKHDSESRTGENPAIWNYVDETVNSFKLTVLPSWRVNERVSLGLQLDTSNDWFSSSYAGSADMRIKQRIGSTRLMGHFMWSVSPRLRIGLYPGATLSYRSLDGVKDNTEIIPSGQLDAQWVISRKLWVTAGLDYFMQVPSANRLGNVIMRQSELEWIEGNPSLKNSSMWRPNLGLYIILPSSMSLNLLSSYTRHGNSMNSYYRPASSEMGGVIKTYRNSPFLESFQVDAVFVCRMFDNRLNINLQPYWYYYRSTGEFATAMGRVRLKGGASYVMGDFRVSLNYSGSEKTLNNAGMRRIWHDDSWRFGLTYGTGDLYVDVSLDNIFNRHNKSWEKISAGCYSAFRDMREIGRQLRISLSYTFGYGKKTDESIDISGPSDTATSILGSGDKDE